MKRRHFLESAMAGTAMAWTGRALGGIASSGQSRSAESRIEVLLNAKSTKVTVLAAKDIHAHNSFESPRNVEPAESQLAASRGGVLIYEFAPASVTRLQITLE